ncbi:MULTISPECIES: protein YnhH [Atlantibacter]|uniref:protein YnhH n=1 Tax=Atlantibacter TaxID=1903434 RepID=UPI003D6FE583
MNGFSILDGLNSYNNFARLLLAETSAYIPLHALLMSPILKQSDQRVRTPVSAHGLAGCGVKIPYPSQPKD